MRVFHSVVIREKPPKSNSGQNVVSFEQEI